MPPRWVRTLQSKANRVVDAARLAAFRQEPVHSFHIVCATYNPSRWVLRHLDSIHDQRYPKALVRHLVCNDASSDDTDALVRGWMAEHPSHRVRYEANEQRLGGCANLTRGFREAEPGTIVLQVDGDDWLPDPGVLAYLDMLYRDPDLWMTYNTWALPDGTPGSHCGRLSREVVRRNGVRDEPWKTSHLHSFRRELFDHVRDEDLKDPETGAYWTASVDMSHYMPMLELAGHHARHVDRITYVYNLNPHSIIQSRRAYQLACEARIRALPRYEPLRSL
jgi:glycosyltransferase involved in cell wall biosynthesis